MSNPSLLPWSLTLPALSSLPLPAARMTFTLPDNPLLCCGPAGPARPATPPPVEAPQPGPAAAGLSEREREVLQRIAAGDSNKVIARRLSLSPHTVKRHVANILDKLELRSRVQAAAWWLRQHAPARPH